VRFIKEYKKLLTEVYVVEQEAVQCDDAAAVSAFDMLADSAMLQPCPPS